LEFFLARKNIWNFKCTMEGGQKYFWRFFGLFLVKLLVKFQLNLKKWNLDKNQVKKAFLEIFHRKNSKSRRVNLKLNISRTRRPTHLELFLFERGVLKVSISRLFYHHTKSHIFSGSTKDENLLFLTHFSTFSPLIEKVWIWQNYQIHH
jgi:hypothetical protein